MQHNMPTCRIRIKIFPKQCHHLSNHKHHHSNNKHIITPKPHNNIHSMTPLHNNPLIRFHHINHSKPQIDQPTSTLQSLNQTSITLTLTLNNIPLPHRPLNLTMTFHPHNSNNQPTTHYRLKMYI